MAANQQQANRRNPRRLASTADEIPADQRERDNHFHDLCVVFYGDEYLNLNAVQQGGFRSRAKELEAKYQREQREARHTRQAAARREATRLRRIKEERAEVKRIEKESKGTITKSHGKRKRHSSDEAVDVDIDPITELRKDGRTAEEIAAAIAFQKKHPIYKVISRGAANATLVKKFPKALEAGPDGDDPAPQLKKGATPAEFAAYQEEVAAWGERHGLAGKAPPKKQEEASAAPAAKRAKITAPPPPIVASAAERQAEFVKQLGIINANRGYLQKPPISADQEVRLRVRTDLQADTNAKNAADRPAGPEGFGGRLLAGIAPRPSLYRELEELP